MCAWAIVSASTGAVQNYQGLLALRFVLGFVEAPFFRKLFCGKQNMPSYLLTYVKLAHCFFSHHGIRKKSLLLEFQFFTLLLRSQVPLAVSWVVQLCQEWMVKLEYQHGDGFVCSRSSA